MRVAIDGLIVVMLLGLAGGVAIYLHEQREDRRRVVQVQAALSALYDRAHYVAALGEAETTPLGMPRVMQVDWFGKDEVPRNGLVDARQPWMDVAEAGDLSWHPPDPVVERRTQAGFWYNPARAVFRARVAPCSSRAATLEYYNRVNGASLTRLPRAEVTDGPASDKPPPGRDDAGGAAPSPQPDAAAVDPPAAPTTPDAAPARTNLLGRRKQR